VPCTPTVREQPGMADPGEMLVRDVPDQPADEREHPEGGERRAATGRAVPEGKAHQPSIVERDPVLGQHRPLGVAPDVTHTETRVQQRGPDVGVPGQAPQTVEQPGEAPGARSRTPPDGSTVGSWPQTATSARPGWSRYDSGWTAA
jgi:hypothetical protein